MLIALLMSSLAHAAEDAPLAVPLTPGFTCVPDGQRLNEGKAMTRCQNELADLKKGNVIIPTAGFVAGAAAGGVVLGPAGALILVDVDHGLSLVEVLLRLFDRPNLAKPFRELFQGRVRRDPRDVYRVRPLDGAVVA
jgi:hypothetical protein